MSFKQFMKDGVGFVERLEVFGNDLTIVNAARVSFAKEVAEISDRDVKLIQYLAKHDHISPFFHPQIRFRLKMPIFVAREWFRHTVGLSRNEVSRRYVDSMPECWIPAIDDLRERDPKLKQGSKETPVSDADAVHSELEAATQLAVESYNSLLARGVAPEIARCILPQSMYTEFIETGSLYAYARICTLRLDPGAQQEIRRYAELIDRAMTDIFPAGWSALRVKFAMEVKTNTTTTAVSSVNTGAGAGSGAVSGAVSGAGAGATNSKNVTVEGSAVVSLSDDVSITNTTARDVDYII